jgi:hypothetical protein
VEKILKFRDDFVVGSSLVNDSWIEEPNGGDEYEGKGERRGDVSGYL